MFHFGLEAGCNPYHLDTFGNNALVPSCAWGSVDSIRTLIAHVPDIDIGAALHFAVLGEGAPEETIPALLVAGTGMKTKKNRTQEKTNYEIYIHMT